MNIPRFLKRQVGVFKDFSEDRLQQLVSGSLAADAKQAIRDALLDHKSYIAEHGEDHPFVLGWRWGETGAAAQKRSSTEADNV